MAKLSSQQAHELAGNFLALALAVGDFRYANWGSLPKPDDRKLADLQWSILNAGEDMLASSATLVMEDVKDSLKRIKSITGQISDTIKSLKDVQKVIDVAAAIVNLGNDVLARNTKGILVGIGALEKSWNF
jgi:hypothetical protein